MHEMPANTGCTGLFDRSWACPEPKKILGNIRNACEMAVSGPRKLAKVQLSMTTDCVRHPTVIWVTIRSESTKIAIAVIQEPITRATIRCALLLSENETSAMIMSEIAAPRP